MEIIKVNIPKEIGDNDEDRSNRSFKDGYKPKPSGMHIPEPIHEEEISERLDADIEN